MSVQDFVTKWEEGLAEALSRPVEHEADLSTKDLKEAAGMPIRSKLQAGSEPETWCCYITGP